MTQWRVCSMLIMTSPVYVSTWIWYLRMATVRASGEVAHGQITSGFRPWDWNTFRKASHDDTDPDDKHGQKRYQNRVETVKNMSVHGRSFYKEGMFVQVKWLTWVRSISHNEHTYGGQVGVSLVLVGHHGPVEVTALYQGNACYQRITKICYIWCINSLFYQFCMRFVIGIWFHLHLNYSALWSCRYHHLSTFIF